MRAQCWGVCPYIYLHIYIHTRTTRALRARLGSSRLRRRCPWASRASQDTVEQVSRAYTAFLSRVRGASWGGPRGSRRSRGRLRAPWDASKGPWQPSGGRLEGVVRASWGLSGGVVVLLGPFSEVSWGHLVLSLGSFGPSRGCFGPCWGSLGGLLNRFGVILTASFPVQGSGEPGNHARASRALRF